MEIQNVSGIALVEIVQLQVAQKSFLERIFSGSKDTTVQVQVIQTVGIVDLPSVMDLPATGTHSPKDRFLLYVSGGQVLDSDPVNEGRVRTIDPFAFSETNVATPVLTGPMTVRMAADLWIGKKMPRIQMKDRL